MFQETRKDKNVSFGKAVEYETPPHVS